MEAVFRENVLILLAARGIGLSVQNDLDNGCQSHQVRISYSGFSCFIRCKFEIKNMYYNSGLKYRNRQRLNEEKKLSFLKYSTFVMNPAKKHFRLST
jgi:hypothetical protein